MLKAQRATTMDKIEERLMEDHSVSLNGVDLHYRTIGDGPVLFLGASGLGSRFQLLAARFQLTGGAF